MPTTPKEVDLPVAGTNPTPSSLTVSDDGVGFVAAVGRSTSFGVVGMRERVLIMGGELSLESELGEGTTLIVRVPLDEEK